MVNLLIYLFNQYTKNFLIKLSLFLLGIFVTPLIMVDSMLGHPSKNTCLVLAINCTYTKAPSSGCCKIKIIVHVILFFFWFVLSDHATQVGMALYGTCRCRRPKVTWLLWGKVCHFHFYWYVNQHYINHAILHS